MPRRFLGAGPTLTVMDEVRSIAFWEQRPGRDILWSVNGGREWVHVDGDVELTSRSSRSLPQWTAEDPWVEFTMDVECELRWREEPPGELVIRAVLPRMNHREHTTPQWGTVRIFEPERVRVEGDRNAVMAFAMRNRGRWPIEADVRAYDPPRVAVHWGDVDVRVRANTTEAARALAEAAGFTARVPGYALAELVADTTGVTVEQARAELERRRVEDREIRERAEAARARVDERAREALLEHLTAKQAEDYTTRGWFEMVVPSGARYRIHANTSVGNVRLLDDKGTEIVGYCAHAAGSLPLADIHLGQMLALKADEAGFLQAANITFGWGNDVGFRCQCPACSPRGAVGPQLGAEVQVAAALYYDAPTDGTGRWVEFGAPVAPNLRAFLTERV